MVTVFQGGVNISSLADPFGMLDHGTHAELQKLDERDQQRLLRFVGMLPPVGRRAETPVDPVPSLIESSVWV